MSTDWSNEPEHQEISLYPDKFPAVVTTDDLVMEVGKQFVKITNLEKLLTQLLQTKQQSECKVNEIQSKLLAFEKSNKVYVEENQKLSDEISRITMLNRGLDKSLLLAQAKEAELCVAKKANEVLNRELLETKEALDKALKKPVKATKSPGKKKNG